MTGLTLGGGLKPGGAGSTGKLSKLQQRARGKLNLGLVGSQSNEDRIAGIKAIGLNLETRIDKASKNGFH